MSVNETSQAPAPMGAGHPQPKPQSSGSGAPASSETSPASWQQVEGVTTSPTGQRESMGPGLIRRSGEEVFEDPESGHATQQQSVGTLPATAASAAPMRAGAASALLLSHDLSGPQVEVRSHTPRRCGPATAFIQAEDAERFERSHPSPLSSPAL